MRNVSPRQFVALFALCLAWCAPGAQVPGASAGAQSPQQNPFQNIPSVTVHLQGVVVSSADGKAVARALVTSGDQRFAAFTDWQGHFSFDYILPASSAASQRLPGLMQMAQMLQFSVRKPGYVNDSVRLRVPAMDPNGPAPVLQLKITPCSTITGHMSVESGEPPKGLFVQLRKRTVQDGEARWTNRGGALIDERGDFRFSGLEPGDYKLMTNDWAPLNAMRQQHLESVRGLLPAFYPDASSLAEATPIHVGAGETVTANLSPHAATFYYVLIPVGGLDATRRIGVSLYPEETGFTIGVDSTGHSIDGFLPSGSYTVRINSFASTPQATQGAPEPSGFAHFQVSSAPVTGPAVTISPGAEIQVNVTRDFSNQQNTQNAYPDPRTQQRRQPASVYLSLQPVDGGNVVGMPGQPDQQGDSFTLRSVPEGVYRVTINAMQGYAASATAGNTDLLREPLTVGSGATVPSIQITLRDDPARLSARVITGQPAQGQQEDADPVFVMCIPLDHPQGQAISGNWSPQWGFQAPQLPPGRYLLLASREQLFNTVEYRNPDALRDLMSEGTVVTLSAGQKAEADIPLMAQGGS